MVTLRVLLVIAHNASATRQEYIAKRPEITTDIAINRIDSAPFGCMMKLITDIDRQTTTETHGCELMMQIAAFHIHVVHHPGVCDTTFEFKITVTAGERYIIINTDRDAWQRVGIIREDHTAHT